MGKLIKYIIYGIIILAVSYAGVTIYANLSNFGYQKEPGDYSFTIKNTGKTIYADHYTVDGTRITLSQYYEYNGKKYILRKNDIVLDTLIYGEINIKRR